MKIDRLRLQEHSRRYLAASIAAAGIIAGGVLLGSLPQPVHALSKKAQAAGAAVYKDKGCQHCHGDDLAGTERGPDLSAIGKKWHKDRIEQQISEGGNGMPAFDAVLQPDEVKLLVDYLSAKRKPARKVPGAKTAAPVNPPVPAKPSVDD